MDTASRYWQLVRLTSSGQCQVQALPQVQAWFQATIASAPEADWSQMIFLTWAAGGPEADLAQLSLRCFISHQIQQVCLGLAQRFGRDYGFAATDLFYLVLDDDGRLDATSPPFSLEILATYDPAKAALSTWASRRTSHHPALNQALLEKGLYRASDWAILNDTQPGQLQRILRQYHLCSEYEVTQATTLLGRYHQVYQRARIAQRVSGKGGRCQTPTAEQLRAINPDLPPKDVLAQLRQLAAQLRQYRVHVRGGPAPVYHSDGLDWETVATTQTSQPPDPGDDQDEFLQAYRQALVKELDGAIAAVIQANVDRLRGRKPPQDRAYVQGLHLFHCRGLPMGKFAADIGLTSQVQVNRLLNLKRLRSEVRHRLLPNIYETVRRQAVAYVSADRLQAIDQTLETLLAETVDSLLAEAAAEAQQPKGRTAKSLFSQQLCITIHSFMPGAES
ncbi:hypothetical protein GFS31_18250 [Leptolyngbya sp. BL0902]|uniref:hypothetical protein n=1 Tax=Leptolyngbya sp. BL0902 TaxID=1115757 RepID=UPI0018E88796|nr:hypothetical protein [Leptolyngbya sp. BL0902]QQE65140.1 hypothetical protein GFS31_18250 [Leptolyngbya sp. BL0902]